MVFFQLGTHEKYLSKIQPVKAKMAQVVINHAQPGSRTWQ
jgi:hypothetical protein